MWASQAHLWYCQRRLESALVGVPNGQWCLEPCVEASLAWACWCAALIRVVFLAWAWGWSSCSSVASWRHTGGHGVRPEARVVAFGAGCACVVQGLLGPLMNTELGRTAGVLRPRRRRPVCGVLLKYLCRASTLVVIDVPQILMMIFCTSVCRTSGAIYISYCQCKMLPVLPVCLGPFKAPGNAIPILPSLMKQCAPRKICGREQRAQML